MRVLSFASFAKPKAAARAEDWSQQDLADFYRAHRLLSETGAAIGLDRGLSDIGEPWLIFYDTNSFDVFMHIARIDGQCILVCEALSIKLKAGHVSDLVAQLEETLKDHLAVKSERQKNVVLHPAARIIMAISAVFLLSKLEGNGAAEAKEDAQHDGDGPISAETAKKSNDAVLVARVQNALSRLFDTADSPRAVASMAGAILTGELLINLQSISHAHNSAATIDKFVELSAAHHAPSVTDGKGELTAEVVVDEQHFDIVAPIVNSGLKAPIIQHGSDQAVALSDVKEDRSLQFEHGADPVQKSVSKTGEPVLADAAPTEVIEPKDGTKTTHIDNPQAVAVLEKLLGYSLTPEDQDNPRPSSDPEVGETPDDGQALDISVASLASLDDLVGFFQQTFLSNSGLETVLSHFLNQIGVFEIEYIGGHILIEQGNTSSLGLDDIGLWTNVLQDGSVISVVGQADLIDDVSWLLT
jgi:hypothetical protein